MPHESTSGVSVLALLGRSSERQEQERDTTKETPLLHRTTPRHSATVQLVCTRGSNFHRLKTEKPQRETACNTIHHHSLKCLIVTASGGGWVRCSFEPVRPPWPTRQPTIELQLGVSTGGEAACASDTQRVATRRKSDYTNN